MRNSPSRKRLRKQIPGPGRCFSVMRISLQSSRTKKMSFGFACVGANRGLFETPATATPKAPRRGRSYNLSSGVRCLSPIVFGHGGCQERTRGGGEIFVFGGKSGLDDCAPRLRVATIDDRRLMVQHDEVLRSYRRRSGHLDAVFQASQICISW